MPTLETALAFFSVAVLLALAPGPDNLFVLMQSATGGRRTGFAVLSGLMIGVMLHTLAVALGLAAVFAASTTAFTVLKLAGAAYLLYLAWGAWRAPAMLAATGGSAAPTAPKPWSRLMLRGVVMNLTNPKVVLFFLAFLPQFADPARGAMAQQVMVLGLVFMLATFLVFGAVACFSGAFGALLQRSARARRLLNRVAGLVFLGLALRLATAQR